MDDLQEHHQTLVFPMKPKVSSSVVLMGELTLSVCATPLPHTRVFTDMLGSTCVGNTPMPQHKNHVDIFNGICVSGSSSPLLSEGPDVTKTRPCLTKGRSLSECSVDSDDSFIVFHGSPGTVACSWNPEDIDSYDSSDSSSDEEEDEAMCIIKGSDSASYGLNSDAEDEDDTSGDTFDGPSQLIEEVNQRWQLENPSTTVHERKSDILRKQVCFAPPESLQTVHPIIAWNYAYRASRVGPWEEMARDRARFRTRIENMEAILRPILNPSHRKKILKCREE